MKSKFASVAALQFMIFLFILVEWHDRTVAEMLTSHILPVYAVFQAWLHWSFWKQNTKEKAE